MNSEFTHPTFFEVTRANLCSDFQQKIYLDAEIRPQEQNTLHAKTIGKRVFVFRFFAIFPLITNRYIFCVGIGSKKPNKRLCLRYTTKIVENGNTNISPFSGKMF